MTSAQPPLLLRPLPRLLFHPSSLLHHNHRRHHHHHHHHHSEYFAVPRAEG